MNLLKRAFIITVAILGANLVGTENRLVADLEPENDVVVEGELDFSLVDGHLGFFLSNGINPMFWKGSTIILAKEIELFREGAKFYVNDQEIPVGLTLIDVSGGILESDACEWKICIILTDRLLSVVDKDRALLSLHLIDDSSE